MQDDNTSPLFSAIRSFDGDTTPVEVLLERDDSDINVRNSKGETPLLSAVQNARCSDILVLLLLQHGADVKATSPQNGNTALHWAAKITGTANAEMILEILLQHGSDVNARNSEGCIPLHLALNRGNCDLACIDVLLNNGSDVNARNSTGDTPLHSYLQHHRNIEALDYLRKFLAKTRNVNAVNSKGETPLHLTVRMQKRVRMFDMVITLLNRGADVNKRDVSGETAIQAYRRVVTNARVRAEPCLLMLLETDQEQLKNTTELHVACALHKLKWVRDLLKLGTDVNAVDSFGCSPLAYVMDRPESKFVNKIVEIMLDYCANINHIIPPRNSELYTRAPEGRIQRPTELSILVFGMSEYSGSNIFLLHLAKIRWLQERLLERGIGLELLSQRTRQEFHRYRNILRNIDKLVHDYLPRCHREMSVMSETEVGDYGITFLDVLLASATETANYAKNKPLIEAFHANKTIFPVYQGMLDAKLARDIERRRLVENAAVLLCDAMQFADPNDEFFERTLSYCGNRDLLCLIEALEVNED